ncbi:MAG: manganese efflux pump [Rikenellaceae bacterium]|nr:manganese efflux pump [Rikenellaceae bacterium]
MSFVELLIIAVGLAMDAFAVSVCKGLSVRRVRVSQALTAGVWFGGFQALMPVAGWLLGVSFAEAVESVDHWVAFVLLGVIGGNMIREAVSAQEECEHDSDFSPRAMLPMAVATSIDAMAVGVSFAFLRVSMWQAATIIGVVTFALSAVGVALGSRLGCRFKQRAELVGGVILVLMGVKILVEHLTQTAG